MQVFFDENVIACDGQTPLAALSAARATASHQSRVIIEVRVDGQDWDGDPDAPIAAKPASLVAFRTAGARQLVSSAWRDLAELIGQIRTTQQTAAQQLQAGDLPAAMAELETTLEAWQVIEGGVRQGAALLDLEPEELLAMVHSEHLLPAHIVELKKIHTAVSDQCWPDLADFLLDEMSVLADQWQTTLGKLAEKLTSSEKLGA